MRILIVGGSGQVGWELQRALAPLGEIVVASRASLNLLDPISVGHVWDDHHPDVLVNAAGYTAVDRAEAQPQEADAINHRAVDILARLAARHGGWLVHFSSDYVYDGEGTAPFVETDTPAPLNTYGRSKLAGDEAIRASGCRHLILRTSWVHAARGQNFVRTILRLAAERTTLNVVDDQVGAPTSAELIADITAHAVRHMIDGDAPDGVYHLAAAGAASWYDVALHIIAEARRLGASLALEADSITPIPTRDYPTPATRPLNSRLNMQKLRETFGITVPDWQHGIARSVAELVAA